MSNRHARQCERAVAAVMVLSAIAAASGTASGADKGKARRGAIPLRATTVATPKTTVPFTSGSTVSTKGGLRIIKPAGSVLEKTIAAAGDLSCLPGSAATLVSCRAAQVSDMILADTAASSFLALGDLQYESGDASAFATSYESTYGRFKARTIPAVGNHEYVTQDAAGYYGYFGAAAHPETKGWYSLDLSTSWHLVVINSNCSFVDGCDEASPQYQWLARDLAATKKPCVMAIWHHPMFTSSPRGSNAFMRPIWDLLAASKADVVLNGHEHNYERFGPQSGDTTADPNAMREFIVGTGGRNTYPMTNPQPNSEVRQFGFGYLRLQLRNRSYSWRFVPEPGSTVFTDSGTASCH